MTSKKSPKAQPTRATAETRVKRARGGVAVRSGLKGGMEMAKKPDAKKE